jgi:hypothetical protein
MLHYPLRVAVIIGDSVERYSNGTATEEAKARRKGHTEMVKLLKASNGS